MLPDWFFFVTNKKFISGSEKVAIVDVVFILEREKKSKEFDRERR
jgi:hypothetical protein